MVRVALIALTAAVVVGAGVWFSRHFDPEVARLLQSRAKQRLEKEHVSYLSVEALGRDVTVVLPPGASSATIAAVKAILATLEGATSVDVHAFGEGGQGDDHLKRIFPKERLSSQEAGKDASRASEFPTPPAEVPKPPRRRWNLSIGRSNGGHVEVFDLGAAQ